MSHVSAESDVPVYDLIGVGFGPSNLALAIAVAERNAGVAQQNVTNALFLERQKSFGWHRGMLIDDATMQVSFLKDLVTLRNPTSDFGFLSYLQDRGRLIDFVNHKNLFPLRIEFHDYLEWAAARVRDVVHYGQEVVSVRPVEQDGVVAYLDVETRSATGESTVRRARNVVLGTGLRPKLPDGITISERIWHNRDLLTNVAKLRESKATPKRFVVVGAGQSAAEAVAYLHRTFADAEVCAVFSRYGYSPADDSSFANRIFDPAAVDEYYVAPDQVKQMMMNYHANTNYAVVDGELIEDLYRRVYQEKVLGTQRLRMLNVSRVANVVDGPDGVRVTVESLIRGLETELQADAVVYSTGYRSGDPTEMLGDLGTKCLRDDQGRIAVSRDYRLFTKSDVDCGIYVQGSTEHTHGITSSLLSNVAIRAGEILESVVGRTPARVPMQGAYAS
ncbi:L-lysine 6-monooxygenase [Pseudonocardiaceae bacterium YIM PH 21723]|nr:L-lysine 6-monooxygenase [Pseudonocardiaceae bacterium YIM PH 21723]